MLQGHCWGSHVCLILTSSNVEKFQVDLPTKRLPLSFKHAIDVARQLGLRYLWTDSLCIIQSGEGAEQDKEKEIAAMEDVYSTAIVNIGATASKAASEGLF